MKMDQIEKDALRGEILKLRATETEYRAQADKRCREYAKKYAKFRIKDKVRLFTNYSERFGVIEKVTYHPEAGIRYIVCLWTKGFKRPQYRRDPVNAFEDRAGAYGSIELINV